jgi:hypothetical protein
MIDFPTTFPTTGKAEAFNPSAENLGNNEPNLSK